MARAITFVESKLESDRFIADQLLEMAIPHSGNSFRLGITGVPGVGKSTFIESFGMLLVNSGRKIAILAVDPSSEISKGSILGDKTRMEKLSVHSNVYIRPTPSGGHLGGVARKTYETILLCEAAGFDFIIVETVGVGQSETTVQHLTDFFLLLMLAGGGDELQGIKRGIMEMADAILITKADGINLQKSSLAKVEFTRAIHYFPPHVSGWTPVVDVCSAVNGDGIESFFETILKFETHQKISGFFKEQRKQQNIFWFEDSLAYGMQQLIFGLPELISGFQQLKQDVAENKISPHTATSLIISSIKSRLK